MRGERERKKSSALFKLTHKWGIINTEGVLSLFSLLGLLLPLFLCFLSALCPDIWQSLAVRSRHGGGGQGNMRSNNKVLMSCLSWHGHWACSLSSVTLSFIFSLAILLFIFWLCGHLAQYTVVWALVLFSLIRLPVSLFSPPLVFLILILSLVSPSFCLSFLCSPIHFLPL